MSPAGTAPFFPDPTLQSTAVPSPPHQLPLPLLPHRHHMQQPTASVMVKQPEAVRHPHLNRLPNQTPSQLPSRLFMPMGSSKGRPSPKGRMPMGSSKGRPSPKGKTPRAASWPRMTLPKGKRRAGTKRTSPPRPQKVTQEPLSVHSACPLSPPLELWQEHS